MSSKVTQIFKHLIIRKSDKKTTYRIYKVSWYRAVRLIKSSEHKYSRAETAGYLCVRVRGPDSRDQRRWRWSRRSVSSLVPAGCGGRFTSVPALGRPGGAPVPVPGRAGGSAAPRWTALPTTPPA